MTYIEGLHPRVLSVSNQVQEAVVGNHMATPAQMGVHCNANWQSHT